jgi:GntR family transcriptional regulator
VAARSPSRQWPNSLESFTEAATRMGLTPTSRVLRAEVAPANLDEADDLSIAPGTPLFHLERIRFLNGVPIAVDRNALPADSVPDFGERDFSEESLFTALSEVGIEFVRADSTIEAREAEASLAEHLELNEGKPVLVMHQIVHDRADKPIFVSTIRYSGERYRMRTFFARSGAFTGRR